MENQAVENKLRIVPYKNGKKKITFYDDHFEIEGKADIKYDDIAIVQSDAMDHSFMYYIVFGRDFTYNFRFTTYDGTKHKFHRYGLSLYGMGLYKRIKTEFETVATPMYNIVFGKVGNRLIDRIANGATANICGLQISKDQIVYTKRKNTITIDRSNFERVVTKSGMSSVVQIFLRGEKKPVFSCSLNADNARLIAPIVNCFFEYQPTQNQQATNA